MAVLFRWRGGAARALVLVVVLVFCAGAVSWPAGASPAQPPPTSTPDAPGIAIAQAHQDLPDPFLLRTGSTYHMYLSSSFGNKQGQNVPVFVGTPGHWSAKPFDAVPVLPSWAAPHPTKGGLSWAPAVYKMGSKYVMYFSPTIKYSLPVQHCIAVATSSSPDGPFVAASKPLVCQRPFGGDIDAQFFVDPAGPNGPSHPDYLIWKSDNNSTPGDGTPTIWAQPVSSNGQTLLGAPVQIYVPDQPWETSLIEAPQMALSPTSTTWLFFSAGVGFFSASYAMGVVKCVGPLGPCTDSNPGPLLGSNAQGPGPGEETYFVGPDASNWLLYSPVHTGVRSNRPVEAARIGWNDAGPYVAQAGTFPSP
jgi:hypothetical protein